ncbi:MAG: alpha/beta fold hydrolase [Oscillochloridaceae bacterium umkhey_bin13]
MQPPVALRSMARQVTIAGGELHCFVAGSPRHPALLLVHGLGDEGDTWRQIIPALANDFYVLAPDLPGFGRSPLPNGPCTVTVNARALAGLLYALNVQRATILGHSGGAMAAQRLALAAPHLVERLILLGGALPITASLPPPGPLYLFLTPGLGELAYTQLRQSQEATYATLRPYYADLDAVSVEEQAFLRQRVWERVWSERQRTAFFSLLRWITLDGAVRAAQYRAQLTHCHVPTTLLWGAHDQIVPQALGQAMATILPHAQFQTLAGAGHNLHHEQPEAVLARLRR